MKCNTLLVLVTLSVALIANAEWVYQTDFLTGPDVAAEGTVTIADGTVQGVVYNTARAFYSIPYAAPPTGQQRWEPPSKPASWSSTLQATKFGPACPQLCDLPPLTCPIRGEQEDCLHLDVYTPRFDAIQELRPVMVFYYGGNYIQGGSSTPLYNGNYLANNTNAVVVVINYRLGALSFFVNDDVKGNLATQDQTFALQWVQANIKAFGGDPNHVTIFGQSAGGSSVACHMVSPAAKGLFHAAIMESNPIQLTLKTPRAMQRLSQRFAEDLGCEWGDLSCLRSKNTSEILTAQNSAIKIELRSPLQAFMPWEPYVDGKVITAQPMDAFRTGDYNQVPFMLGNVEDEGTIFIYEAFPEPLPVAEYKAVLAIIFRGQASNVYNMYPVPEGETDARDTMAKLGTDFIWACPQRNLSRYMSQNHPVYYYRFDHVFSFDPWGPNYHECVDYCCHGSELPYVFNSGKFFWDSDEAKLAHLLSTHWGNFATSHDPNLPYAVETEWKQFEFDSNTIMHYQTPSSSNEVGYLESYCDFFDSIGYDWGE